MSMKVYKLLDQSPLVQYLFYPRKTFLPPPGGAFDFAVQVEKGISISCRFYEGEEIWPWILYFHGNGEVVSDYNSIAPCYHQQNLNLVVADYRGYGRSDGVPAFSTLVADAHKILKAVKDKLENMGAGENLWVMGRSLGSISALELAFHYPNSLKGLIIESGFISVVRLIEHLGLPTFGLNLSEIDRECLEKAGGITLPSLVIHGDEDNLVPLQQGEELYSQLGSEKKQLVIIPGAGHNDIMFVERDRYFSTIKEFIFSGAGGGQ